MKSKIFINYRREDSRWNSVALYQELIKYFPKENIFKDFNAIEPGKAFRKEIEEALASCNVLLVLISEQWLDIKDSKGNIRIHNANDFVRIEIAAALKRDITVIPVLFNNAVLPQPEDLPDDLKSLAERQAIEIDNTRFETDTKRLVDTIKKVLTVSNRDTTTDTPRTAGSKKSVVILLSVVVIAVILYYLIDLSNRDRHPENGSRKEVVQYDSGNVVPSVPDSRVDSMKH